MAAPAAVPSRAFIVPFRAKIPPCSASSRLCWQRFATAPESVSVLQQGYKVGTSKGCGRLPVLYSRGEGSAAAAGGWGGGQLPEGPQTWSGVCRGGAGQGGGGGRTRGGQAAPSPCPSPAQ